MDEIVFPSMTGLFSLPSGSLVFTWSPVYISLSCMCRQLNRLYLSTPPCMCTHTHILLLFLPYSTEEVGQVGEAGKRAGMLAVKEVGKGVCKVHVGKCT